MEGGEGGKGDQDILHGKLFPIKFLIKIKIIIKIKIRNLQQKFPLKTLLPSLLLEHFFQDRHGGTYL